MPDMPLTSLPPFTDILSKISAAEKDSPLPAALAILFEPSPSLFESLVPQVAVFLHTSSNTVNTYFDLIDASLKVISQWDETLKADFIAGHPRIGEASNLSQLSAKEQAAVATPPEVLARLGHLNACYERRYSGLRYITFVNGRSRTAIMEEMEDVLGLPRSLSASCPSLESVDSVRVGEAEWRVELERAVQDVGRIAKSRLKTLGVQ